MRLTLLLTGVTLLLACGAPEAQAHGGQFRGPGGSVEPGLRDPHDPTPTRPEDPVRRPTTPAPGDPPRPPSGGPVTPPAQPGAPTDPSLGGGGGGRRAALSYESWMFWYEHNREGIEELKTAIYSHIESPNPLGQLGGGRDSAGQDDGATQGTASGVRTRMIPALLWALEPRNAGDPDVEGAAAIALAKVTQDPLHIDRLRALLSTARADARPELVRESAALALGLLRRAAPERQFTAGELDRARSALFEVLRDGQAFSTRTRGFAAVALGLLGDQPTGTQAVGAGSPASGGPASGSPASGNPAPGSPASNSEAAAATTARLLDLLTVPHADEALPVALLLALGLQPRASFGAAEMEVLTQIALRGRLGSSEAGPLVRSYATLALGRVGDPAAVKTLHVLLTARTSDVHTRRSAAIGLGRLGRLLPPAQRADLARHLREALERSGDTSTKNFGLMSLAYLLAHELGERASDTLTGAGIGAYLVSQATDGAQPQRPFAALALGWVLRAMGDEAPTAAHVELRTQALEALRAGLQGRALDPRNRAAFALALGMARDLAQRSALLAVAADGRQENTLRGYAAVGVGLLGSPSPEVRSVLRRLVEERSSEELTQQAATALGLAQDRGAVELLIAAHERSESSHVRTQLMLALARIGDARAIAPLERALRDTLLSPAARAVACAGLGVVGDLEPLPSMARLTRDLNYRASNELVSELASIL